MSEENIEIVRRIYEGWSHGDFSVGVEAFAPDIHFESFMPDSTERSVAEGVDGIAAFMREFLSYWRDYRILGDKFIDDGRDKVVVIGRQAALGRTSGAPVEGPTNSVWTFIDGKVTGLSFHVDPREALEAIGRSED